MRRVKKFAEHVWVGDWLVEDDGTALEICRKQIGSDFVLLHFTALGTMPVPPRKIAKTDRVEVLVPEK